MDKQYVLTALGYALLGLALGIYMAASKNHGHLVTHAHIMLLGFVVSFIYALFHKLWLNNSRSGLAKAQYYIHQLGTLVLLISLFLLYAELLPADQLSPILAISSILVFIGVLLMKVLFIQASRHE